MKESKTIYSYLIEHMESPSFKKVRDLACDFVRKLPQELCDELHNSLNRGVDILDSEALLQMYFYAFGEMHAAKLNYAFEHLQQYIKEAKEVELIDYGCGQGMASICYHDFIKNVNPSQEISRVTLIEPSEMALSRASLLCSHFYPNAEIVTVNKDFENLSEKDIELSSSIPTIHLFSNILDVESYEIEKFAQLVKTISSGDNEYVIVSPIQNANRMKRLKDFVTTLDNNQYFEQYLDKREFKGDKDWTCAVLMSSSKNGKYGQTCTYDSEVAEKYFSKDWESSLYSEDGKRLIFVDEKTTFFNVKKGTEIICDGAFQNCEFLRDVTIPDSIRVIGEQSFYGCKSVRRIEIPNSVCIIKDRAFVECDSLSEIVIPENVVFIGNNPFPKCKIICNSKKYVIDNDALFTLDKKLLIGYYGNHSKFCIPENVEKIGNEAFAGNSELINITIPDSVVDIGDRAFMGVALNDIVLPQSLVNIGDEAFTFSCLENIVIPKSVKTIGDNALASFKSISFEGSVDRIGSWTWSFFPTIEKIVIPKNSRAHYEKILPNDLHAYLRETGFIVEELDLSVSEKELLEAWTDEYGVKYSKDHKKLLSIPSTFIHDEYEVKEGTEIICDEAFFQYRPNGFLQIYHIKLPDSVRYIGNKAFCRSYLKTIRLSNNLLYIGDYAFSGCNTIKSFELPSSVKYIGQGCFGNCAFSRFVIPKSVEFIKGNPWSGNFTSCKFVVENHSPFYTVKNGHLYSKDLKTIVCCLDDKEFGTSTLENVFYIAGSAFSNCHIKTLNIPETVVSIGDYAFYECFGFEEVQLPDSLKSIGEYAFYHTQIKRIEIPDSVERIGSHAFGSCSQLVSINLSNSLTMISDSMLASSSVYEIIIPPKVEQINNSAFCACSKLYKVIMNEGIIDIGYNAFSGCFNLNEINIPSSVTHIGEDPFPRGRCQIRCLSKSFIIKNGMLFTADMKLLISCLYSSGEVEIPKGVEIIGRSAFDSGITSIIIPNSVKTICRYAFSGTSIKTITIPKSVTRIERSALTDCNELEEIRILNKNIEIDSEQFANGCESLKVILIPQGSYSYFFDIFEKWRLRDILVEGTKKSIFNDEDRVSINEVLHKNTMFRHPIIEKNI